MNAIQISNVAIRQISDTLYNLTNFHKAAGRNDNHKPTFWLRNQQTNDLIDEIVKAGNPALDKNQHVIKVVKGDNQSGTYVCKELVIAYGMWINPAFGKVVRHDFGGFNVADGVAQKAGKAYVFAAAAAFGEGDFGAVSADDVADGLIFWCDAKGAAGDFGFGLRRPCLCFGGRAKCFGADVATQAHADKVLAVSFGNAGHDVDLKKGWCI